jgi:hypothetical protein
MPSTYTKSVPDLDRLLERASWEEPIEDFYEDNVRYFPYSATKQPRREIVERNRAIGRPVPRAHEYIDYQPRIQANEYQNYLEAMEQARKYKNQNGELYVQDPVTGEWTPDDSWF